MEFLCKYYLVLRLFPRARTSTIFTHWCLWWKWFIFLCCDCEPMCEPRMFSVKHWTWGVGAALASIWAEKCFCFSKLTTTFLVFPGKVSAETNLFTFKWWFSEDTYLKHSLMKRSALNYLSFGRQYFAIRILDSLWPIDVN